MPILSYIIIPNLHSVLYLSLLYFSTGAVSARNIQLVKKKQMRCQGVVCATKVRETDIITWTFLIEQMRHSLGTFCDG